MQGRDTYVQKAHQAAEKLRRKLQPQWSSRDQVKQKLGSDRWTNNPHPKNDYAALRKQDEGALKVIETAIQQLNELNIPQPLNEDGQYRPRPPSLSPPPASLGGNGQGPPTTQNRYNGQRPTDLSQRVSLQDYPDPTDLGWIFTGSNATSRVEFFESPSNSPDTYQTVRLDWYYTTATIKTSLYHPTQGATQLFGHAVTPDLYLQILQNPRAHTNMRYHTRANKPH